METAGSPSRLPSPFLFTALWQSAWPCRQAHGGQAGRAVGSRTQYTRRCWVGRLGCGFGAEAGYDEADFFVRDLGGERLFERLEAVHSKLAAGGGDLVVAFGA